MSQRIPALFIGHGNPMNALRVNSYTERWAALGNALPNPKAILSVSAHWYIQDAAVTVSTAPRTIHDFGVFPRELYQVQLGGFIRNKRSEERRVGKECRSRCSQYQ